MQRYLEWDGCANARDLGGYATTDGRETRWGVILRSDHLARLTPGGRAALVAQGVRTIVDLRLPHELLIDPNPFATAGEHGVEYAHLSFLDPSLHTELDFATLADDYKHNLDLHLRSVGAIVTAIARAPEGGVLIHCAAGKDRTGMISALVLELAGVPRATIGADYALTEERLRARSAAWLEHGLGERADRERQIAWSRPHAEVILEALDHLDARYGGAQSYLLAAGVDPEDLARLRQRLVGPD